jgi:pantoate--beta-alanine ligase
MKILFTIPETHAASGELHRSAQRLGLVPTMGALHDGHLSLVRAARAASDTVAVSIFVNPTQFGPSEDLAKYPRQFERDCQLLQQEDVDLVFAPTANEMYLKGEVTWVVVEGLSGKLDGRSRPSHFRGVTTVVSKLFNILQPDLAFFGQKDAAQVAIIRRMVRDLNFPVEIRLCPIIREPDGLAMSSRNAYLNPGERQSALVLHRALLRMEEKFRVGETRSADLIRVALDVFAKQPEVRLDYFEIVDPDTLEPVEAISRPALAAAAAYVGPTRLIDNIVLHS